MARSLSHLVTRALQFIPSPFNRAIIMPLTPSTSPTTTNGGILSQCPRSLHILTSNGDAGPSYAKKIDMDSEIIYSYSDAVRTLNSLQSNAENLRESIAKRSQNPLPVDPPSIISTQKCEILQNALMYLQRGGLTAEQLNSMNVIHVSGTKGKGTTCAFVESILRHAGLRTGFFSSPHLVSVRERIRINGKPLSQKKFTKYFYEVYDSIVKQRESATDMPPYFRFLTCMGYYALFHEKVDVAIIEVGMGGALDPTNIIRKPTVTGITSLGMEHVRILGDTLEKIAYQKAGIMKPGAPAFTVGSHPPEILKVLEEYAEAVKCPLHVAPSLEAFGEVLDLGVDDGKVSRINAALGLQLATAFLAEKFPEKMQHITDYKPGSVWPLTDWHIDGLQNCTWHGRFQILRAKDNLTYYLDGAHTKESLDAARRWFMYMSRPDSFRVLIFHVTGERNAEELMRPFAKERKVFHLAIFCPLVVSSSRRSPSADNWSAAQAGRDDMKHCYEQCAQWMKLVGPKTRGMVVESVDQVLSLLDQMSDNNKPDRNKNMLPGNQEHPHTAVLITGSLHLVGTYLSILDPDLASC